MRFHVTLLFVCVLFFSNLNGKNSFGNSSSLRTGTKKKKNLESQQKLQKNNNNQFQFGVSECCFLPKLLFPPLIPNEMKEEEIKKFSLFSHTKGECLLFPESIPSWFLKKMEKQISLSERKPCKTHPKNQITGKKKTFSRFPENIFLLLIPSLLCGLLTIFCQTYSIF